MVEDVRFLLEGAIRGARFEHAPGLGAQYRVASSGSLSTSDPSKFFECCFKNTRYMEGLWRAQGEMSEDRKKALLKAYSITARASFERNRLLFESAYAAIKKLDPKYVPEEPRRIYYLSKLLGYRNAERAALWYRNIKRTGRPA